MRDVADPSRRQADPVEQAVAFIFRSTKQRPQTEAEMDAKLSSRCYESSVRVAALDRAKDVGAIDDIAFARAWVADRGLGRGYGAPRLRQELTRRGVPTAILDDALDALADRDPADVAMRLASERVRRLPPTLSPEAVARRLVGFLTRRGYEVGLSRRVAITVSGLDREWD